MKALHELEILIVGLGQIGGSIGIDLVERCLVAHVTGYDRKSSITEQAVKRGVIHRAEESLEKGISQADLVILAAPIREILKLIPVVCSITGKESAVLDVASTKGEILNAVTEVGGCTNYIAGHPLAGNEKRGLAAAEPGQFDGQTFVLAPSEATASEWIDIIMELVIGLGARPLLMSAEKHDRLIAVTSNLPYLFAVSLMRLAIKKAEKDPDLWKLIGGSFKSATRVAASSPELTLDMFMTNRRSIAEAIDGAIRELQSLREMIESGNETALKEIIDLAANKCETLSNK